MANAYVTLVMKGDKYIPGAIVLAESLKTVGSKYPTICMITNDVSEDGITELSKHFTKVIGVPYITKKSTKMISQKQEKIYSNWIQQSYTKWNILNHKLFDYDKLLFVDADMIFLENCDCLFNLPAPAMTFSSPWAKPYRRNGINNPYGELKHGESVNAKSIIKGFTSIVGVGSLVLVEPDDSIFDAFKSILSRDEIYGHSKCINGVDEQSITETYLSIGCQFTHIHQQYNWLVGKSNWLINGEKPKTYHYYNTKPWEMNRSQWEDLQNWWQHADSICKRDPESSKWFPTIV